MIIGTPCCYEKYGTIQNNPLRTLLDCNIKNFYCPNCYKTYSENDIELNRKKYRTDEEKLDMQLALDGFSDVEKKLPKRSPRVLEVKCSKSSSIIRATFKDDGWHVQNPFNPKDIKYWRFIPE